MRNAIILASALGAAALLGLPLAGCDGGGDGTGGGGGSGGGGAGGGADVGGACKSLAAALCGQIDTCSPFLMQVTYGDRTTCEARVAARCDDPVGVEGSNVTAADIAACAAAYEARTCDQLFEPAPGECRVPGDEDDGATCSVAAECKGSLCKKDTEGTCGTCATPLAEGAACAPDTDVCDVGLYCDATSMKCAKPAASGEACPTGKPCAPGLSCSSGTCGPLLGEGQDCSGGETCNFAEGLICFPLDDTCTKVVVKKAGEQCGFDMATGEVSICEADSLCGDTDTCVARPLEGEACAIDPDSGEGDCASGFDCIGGECAAGAPQCD